MRYPARTSRKRPPHLLGGFLLALVLTLAPQVSLASVELACELVPVEVSVVGASCRSVRPDWSAEPSSRAATGQQVSRDTSFSAQRRVCWAATLPGEHTLPSGQRAPLIC